MFRLETRLKEQACSLTSLGQVSKELVRTARPVFAALFTPDLQSLGNYKEPPIVMEVNRKAVVVAGLLGAPGPPRGLRE